MADILKLSEGEFQVEVLEATLPVLVDFSAAWCAPCKMLDPVVQQLAGKTMQRTYKGFDKVRCSVGKLVHQFDMSVVGRWDLYLMRYECPVTRLSDAPSNPVSAKPPLNWSAKWGSIVMHKVPCRSLGHMPSRKRCSSLWDDRSSKKC